MARFRPPGPILLLVVSSMLLESGALASHPLTAHPVAAQGQVPPDPAAPGVATTALPPPSVDALEADMLARLNAERAAAGVGPVQDQPWAHSVARQHSDEMAGARDIWHNMAGYMGEGHRVLGATLLAENVSMDRTLDANDARLLASPEHHQNIVDPQFNFVGIGIARDANDWIYVTEDFSAVPHGAVQASLPHVKTAPVPAAPAPEPAPAPTAAQPAPPRAAAPPAAPRTAAQPAPAGAVPAPVQAPAAAPVAAGAPTTSTSPDLVAASPPALALPALPPAQGAAVPAPVEAPAAPRVPSARVALAVPALPTAAPLGDAAPSRGAAPGASQPLADWVSLAPERVRRLLPAAGVALFLGALLFSRRIPAPVRPPRLENMVVAGSGHPPVRFRGRSSRPWIAELPRGPPVAAGVGCCFA